MDLSLYLYVGEADPRQSRVVGASDLTRLPLPILTHGDRLNVSIYLLSAAGTYHADSTNASLGRTLTLGLRGSAAVAQTSTFTAIANGFSCTLDLNTTALGLLLRASRAGQLALVHKTTGSGPNPTTRCSLDCTVLGDVATAEAGTTPETGGYYTAAEVDAFLSTLPRALPAITGLTGGTAADLDGIGAATLATYANGSVLELFFTGGVFCRYLVRARSPADEAEVGAAAGGFLIVFDQDTTRCAELLSVHKQGVSCTWNADTAKWHQVVGSGTGTGVSTAIAQEASAFSLPA